MRGWITALSLCFGCASPPPAQDACKIIAVPAPGPLQADRRAAGDAPAAVAALFHREAALTGDSGFRALAERAAACGLSRDPNDDEARAQHVAALYHTHRFVEAEEEARGLTSRRGAVGDWLLLGDARMEQGHLDGAADAYQRAADLSPDAAVFDRIMYLRWLWGDEVGALEMAQRAVDAAADVEQRAWSLAWLGWLRALAGQPAPELDASIALNPRGHQALLMRAAVRLHQGDRAGAAADLDATWADFATTELRHELDPAVDVAAACALDSRGCAIRLAETDPERATRLIEEEWKGRQDALTRAARAWVLSRRGQDMRSEAKAALEAGPIDPQVLYLTGRVLQDPDVMRRALQTGPGLRPSQRAALEGLLTATAGAPDPG